MAEKTEPTAGSLRHSASTTFLATAMNPTSLLNVSPELLREHVRLGMPEGPMAAASDRAWTFGVCLALAAVAALLVVTLH